jgi:hypothetical protein
MDSITVRWLHDLESRILKLEKAGVAQLAEQPVFIKPITIHVIDFEKLAEAIKAKPVKSSEEKENRWTFGC